MDGDQPRAPVFFPFSPVLIRRGLPVFLPFFGFFVQAIVFLSSFVPSSMTLEWVSGFYRFVTSESNLVYLRGDRFKPAGRGS